MYGYCELLKDAEKYEKKGAQVFPIGKSLQGREILCFAVGKGEPIISTAAIHARENATAYAVLAQLDFALSRGTLSRQCFIPLVNPDGAEILRRYIEGGEEKYKLWKANARGVDLNVNFDVRWGTGKENLFVSGSENYVGTAPMSEPETRALALFTKESCARMTLSYHTAGREMYWYFHQEGERLMRDRAIAEKAESFLKHRYERIDSSLSSAGGYKDYCIEKLGLPALTIELGKGGHPLGKRDIEEDAALNEGLVCELEKLL